MKRSGCRWKENVLAAAEKGIGRVKNDGEVRGMVVREVERLIGASKVACRKL